MGEPTGGRMTTARAWLNVGVAALLMVATLPGRSHGLGLLTNPILADFQLDRTDYGTINLWASLLGALFCLPCGWLIDRAGTRPVLTGVLLALGGTVVAMSGVHSVALLAVCILLTRGFGQSALSVVSLGILGKTPLRRREMAMGVFGLLIGVGFAAAVVWFQAAEQGGMGWRAIWLWVGVILLVGVLPISFVLLREPGRPAVTDCTATHRPDDFTLTEALRTPAFWAVALTCSLFNLVSAGTALHYEDILTSFGFTRTDYQNLLAASFMFGTAFNLVCGWLAFQWPMTRLLGFSSVVLAGALAMLPYLRTMPQLYAYAAAGGFVAGAVTVVFFAVWPRLYGPRPTSARFKGWPRC
jgi:MFS family permease